MEQEILKSTHSEPQFENSKTAMLERDKILSSFLVHEAKQNYNTEDWNHLLYSVVPVMLEDKAIEDIPQVVRLALSIVIVGAECDEYFGSVFRMMCDWEHLRGPYWVIQVELLRHSCLSIIKNFLAEDGGEDGSTLMTLMDGARVDQLHRKLLEFIPDDMSAFLAHEILRQQADELRLEIVGLVDSLEAEFDVMGAKARVQEYGDQYPLSEFSTWMLEWGQHTLAASDTGPYNNPAFWDEDSLIALLEAATSADAIVSTSTSTAATDDTSAECASDSAHPGRDEQFDRTAETVVRPFRPRVVIRRTANPHTATPATAPTEALSLTTSSDSESVSSIDSDYTLAPAPTESSSPPPATRPRKSGYFGVGQITTKRSYSVFAAKQATPVASIAAYEKGAVSWQQRPGPTINISPLSTTIQQDWKLEEVATRPDTSSYQSPETAPTSPPSGTTTAATAVQVGARDCLEQQRKRRHCATAEPVENAASLTELMRLAWDDTVGTASGIGDGCCDDYTLTSIGSTSGGGAPEGVTLQQRQVADDHLTTVAAHLIISFFDPDQTVIY